MKFFIIFVFFFSFKTLAKVCNSNGKCWDNKTIKRIYTDFCETIGKKRSIIAQLNKETFRRDGFDLKENYDLINCYKQSHPLNISKTIIMRDLWPGHLSAHLCYASRSTNLNDLKWVKNGIKNNRRFHWQKYLKPYKFALNKRNEFTKYCNGSPPYDR